TAHVSTWRHRKTHDLAGVCRASAWNAAARSLQPWKRSERADRFCRAPHHADRSGSDTHRRSSRPIAFELRASSLRLLTAHPPTKEIVATRCKVLYLRAPQVG